MGSTRPTNVLVLLVTAEPDNDYIRRLESKCPGLEVRWVNTDLGLPDGTSRRPWDLESSVYDGCTILYSFFPAPAELVPDLRFVQLPSAGADLWADHPKFLDPNVPFCTTSGSNAPQIAEWVIGAWLSFQHKFPMYQALQAESTWAPARLESVQDSAGARVGILGYGSIGRQVARLCKALGMTILAFTASPRPTPESRKHNAFHLPNLGDPTGALPTAWFHGGSSENLAHFLAQDLDLLVIAMPLTPATRGLISSAQFDILGAHGRPFLVNVARGAIVDSQALVHALQAGQVRGAALDVTEPEPLPREHALWTAPNCFVTPHVSYHSRSQMGRCLGILEENVERFVKGEGELLNELKKKR